MLLELAPLLYSLECLLTALMSLGKGGQATRTSMNNVVMELRKCCLHPYLINGVEPDDNFHSDQYMNNLVKASGKLELLDKMLKKLLVWIRDSTQARCYPHRSIRTRMHISLLDYYTQAFLVSRFLEDDSFNLMTVHLQGDR